MQIAFQIYDDDNSGFLEEDEIRKLVGDLCLAEGLPPIKEKELKQFIKMFDANRDCKFEFEECLPMFEYISDLLTRRKSKQELSQKSKFLKIKMSDINEFLTSVFASYANQNRDELSSAELLILLSVLCKDQE